MIMKLERHSVLRDLLTVAPKVHRSPDKAQYYQQQQQFIETLCNNVSSPTRRSQRFSAANNMVTSIYNITRELTTGDDPICIRPIHFGQWSPTDGKCRPAVDVIPSCGTVGIRQSPSTDSGFDSSPSSPGDVTPSSIIDNHNQLKSSPSISSLSSVSSSSSQCRWMSCVLVFDNDTLLFDHVMKTHILILKPTSIKTRNTTGQRIITTITNRPVDDHPIKCRWSQCGMRLQRGDSGDKRFAWLEEHFATRHAGRALPYPCLIDGCTQRFSFKRSLEDHLRAGHVDQQRVSCKRNASFVGGASSSSMALTGTDHDGGSCKRVRRRVDCMPFFVPPIDPKMDFFDVGTGQLLAERLAYAADRSTARLMLVVNDRIDDIRGAKYRKQYRNFPMHTIVTTTSTNKKDKLDDDQHRNRCQNASTILRKLFVNKQRSYRK